MAPRTQPRRAASNSPARFSRVARQTQESRHFARSASTPSSRRFGRPTQPSGRPTQRRRQSRSTGAQGLLKRFGSALPLGGSSGRRGNRSGGSLPVVGGLLKSVGGNQRGGTGRGRKSAMLGLLGAGAAGAAVIAKRRKGSTSSASPAVENSAESQTPTPATQTPRPYGPTAGEDRPGPNDRARMDTVTEDQTVSEQVRKEEIEAESDTEGRE
jgi:hypothetical protein